LRGVKPYLQPFECIYSVDFCASPGYTLSIMDARGNSVAQHGAPRIDSNPAVRTGAPRTTHTLAIKDMQRWGEKSDKSEDSGKSDNEAMDRGWQKTARHVLVCLNVLQP